MCLTPSTEFSTMESWLTILLETYNSNPTYALAQTINYYLGKLLNHDDIHYCGNKRCDYLIMQRFWHWRSTNCAVTNRPYFNPMKLATSI